jgi:hypothetical protein
MPAASERCSYTPAASDSVDDIRWRGFPEATGEWRATAYNHVRASPRVTRPRLVTSGVGPDRQFAATQRCGRYRGTPDCRGTRAAPRHLTRSGHVASPSIPYFSRSASPRRRDRDCERIGGDACRLLSPGMARRIDALVRRRRQLTLPPGLRPGRSDGAKKPNRARPHTTTILARR